MCAHKTATLRPEEQKSSSSSSRSTSSSSSSSSDKKKKKKKDKKHKKDKRSKKDKKKNKKNKKDKRGPDPDETPQERRDREKEAKRVCTLADNITNKLSNQKAPAPLQPPRAAPGTVGGQRRAAIMIYNIVSKCSGLPLYCYDPQGYRSSTTVGRRGGWPPACIRQVSMDQVLGDSRVAMLPDPFQAQLNATMKKFNDALDKCAVAKDVF